MAFTVVLSLPVRVVWIVGLMWSSASSSSTCTSLYDLKWMLGSWESIGVVASTIEIWTAASETAYEGRGYRVTADGHESGNESLLMVSMQNQIFYIAKPPKTRYPVAFLMTECTERSVLFENQQHDFPKSIKYYSRDADVLEAVVGNGKDNEFRLRFVRKAVH